MLLEREANQNMVVKSPHFGKRSKIADMWVGECELGKSSNVQNLITIIAKFRKEELKAGHFFWPPMFWKNKALKVS